MRTRLFLELAAAGLCAAGVASAGPNANGVMIVHASTGLVVSDSPTNYCGQAGLEHCADTVVTLSGGDAASPHAWFAIAAFPD